MSNASKPCRDGCSCALGTSCIPQPVRLACRDCRWFQDGTYSKNCGHIDVREFDMVSGWHAIAASKAREGGGKCGLTAQLWAPPEPLPPGARSLTTIFGLAILVSIAVWWWAHG